MIAPSGSRCESSQNTSCGLIGSALSWARSSISRHHAATFDSICSRQARSSLRCKQRDQRAQRLRRIADEVDLHRVADPEHAAVDVDLHAARLALLRQELRVGEARADHQQRVAVLHQVPARLRAEQADRARSPTAARPAAPPCRAAPSPTPAPSSSATSRDLGAPRRSAPAPTRIATRSPALRISAARARSVVVRHDARRGVAEPRVDGAVRGRRRLDRVLQLQVVGDDHARDRPLACARSGPRDRSGGGSARRCSPSARTRRRRP